MKAKPSTTKKAVGRQVPGLPEKTLDRKKAFYLLLGLLGALALFVFRDFIFLNKVFLYKDIGSDSINAWYPDFYHIATYLQQPDGFPRWSFYLGMGQNISGLLIGDPFTWLLYFADADHIAYLLGPVEALKIITAGVFFYLFLRQLKVATVAAIVGGICFAFSGFMVLCTCWYVQSAEAYQVAFLLFATEKLLRKKWGYFPFAIAIIGVTNPFNLYLLAIVVAVYVFVRLFNEHGRSKKIVVAYGKIAALGVLGVGLGAFIIIPKIQMMLDSPRVSGEVSYFSAMLSTSVFQLDGALDNFTKIGRLFSNDMLGAGNYFAGAENYFEAPLFYAGLISLILFPQLFPFLSKKKKWLLGGVFAGALLPFVFPFFRHAFWLFAGNYYRLLSFLFAVVLMVYAVFSLHHILQVRKVNYRILAGTLAVLILLLYAPNIAGMPHPYQANLPLFQSGIQSFCLFFLLLYTVLVGLLPLKRAARVVLPALAGLLFIELAFMANTTVNKRDIVTYGETKQKVSYNDYSVDAVQYLHRIDTSFYRIQKTYGSSIAIHKSLKDPMVQGFYGTTSYIQFNQSNYVRFLLAVNVIPPGNEHATRWIEGLTVNRPLLQVFGNVRYNLSKQPFPAPVRMLNDSLTTIGDVHIYKNKFSLPFGYTYSQVMWRSAFDSLEFKDVALLQAAIIDDADSAAYAALNKLEVPPPTASYGLEQLSADVAGLQQNAFEVHHFSQNKIAGTITLDRPQLVFFTIPFDKGWKITDNGHTAELAKINVGFSGILLSPGTHRLELHFEAPFYTASVIISWASLLLALLLYIYFFRNNIFRAPFHFVK